MEEFVINNYVVIIVIIIDIIRIMIFVSGYKRSRIGALILVLILLLTIKDTKYYYINSFEGIRLYMCLVFNPTKVW